MKRQLRKVEATSRGHSELEREARSMYEVEETTDDN
jgi:hypothetical protein